MRPDMNDADKRMTSWSTFLGLVAFSGFSFYFAWTSGNLWFFLPCGGAAARQEEPQIAAGPGEVEAEPGKGDEAQEGAPRGHPLVGVVHVGPHTRCEQAMMFSRMCT